jgi:hypothetical protein
MPLAQLGKNRSKRRTGMDQAESRFKQGFFILSRTAPNSDGIVWRRRSQRSLLSGAGRPQHTGFLLRKNHHRAQCAEVPLSGIVFP